VDEEDITDVTCGAIGLVDSCVESSRVGFQLEYGENSGVVPKLESDEDLTSIAVECEVDMKDLDSASTVVYYTLSNCHRC
jgi:hypothetical protein